MAHAFYRMGTPNNFTYFTLIEWVPQTILLSQKFFLEQLKNNRFDSK